MEVKILRLTTGEDIICEIIDVDADCYYVLHANIIQLKLDRKGSPNLLLGLWTYPELVDFEIPVSIYKTSIIAEMEPKESIIDFFTLSCEKRMLSIQDMLDNEDSDTEMLDVPVGSFSLH